ncbi:histidine phosphatase family protein [Actibacterium sp. D379-3]
MAQATELTMIRHAPVVPDGRVYGRRDRPADCSDTAAFEALRLRLPAPARIVHSPALRCVQTVATLWPGQAASPCPALWEQDLGAWEGIAYAEMPDLGLLSREELAVHCPPDGESFADLCARAGHALSDLAQGGPTTIVAHAGTIRAALSLALGTVPGALAFEIAPLSVTRIACLPGGNFVIRGVNECHAPAR